MLFLFSESETEIETTEEALAITGDATDNTESTDTKKEDQNPEEGLEGKDLFRCGNTECGFRAEYVADFRDHVAICDYSADSLYLICFHCKKQCKHVATLVDHLKQHGNISKMLIFTYF